MYIEKRVAVDQPRLGNLGSYGLFFCGLCHYWYKGLDQVFGSQMTLKPTLKKLMVDQLVLAPFDVILVFVWTQAGMGKEVLPKVKSNFVPLLMANYMIWLPTQAINFWLVPQKHRVLFQSVVMVLWTACLSYASNNDLRLK